MQNNKTYLGYVWKDLDGVLTLFRENGTDFLRTENLGDVVAKINEIWPNARLDSRGILFTDGAHYGIYE